MPCALAGPIPGRDSSSAAVAVLTLMGPPAALTSPGWPAGGSAGWLISSAAARTIAVGVGSGETPWGRGCRFRRDCLQISPRRVTLASCSCGGPRQIGIGSRTCPGLCSWDVKLGTVGQQLGLVDKRRIYLGQQSAGSGNGIADP